jgi:hypothetical protein
LKRALKLTAVLLGLLLLIVFFGGWLLQPQFRVERSMLIQAQPAKIYSHLDSSSGWQRWGVWYRRDPQMQLSTLSDQGVGAQWRWTSQSQGNGSMRLTELEAGRRVAYELQIEDFAPSSGELRLVPEAQGTRVIWLMQGDMGGNPINRWFGLFMDSLVGPDFEAGLANLKQLSETGVR